MNKQDCLSLWKQRHPEIIDRYLPWSEELPERCRLKIEKKKQFKN